MWTGKQTAGRGRSGRKWQSPPGNLAASLLVRPDQPASQAARLTFVASLAVADAVAGHLDGEAAVTCKWPNDVLVGGRKIAGLLLEAGTDARGDMAFLIIGVGINVVAHPPPEGLLYPATALHAEGARKATDAAVLTAFCQAWAQWRGRLALGGFPVIRDAWLARAQGRGQAIRVRLPEGDIDGLFADLDAEGALLVDTDGGQRRIVAGDVVLAPVARLA